MKKAKFPSSILRKPVLAFLATNDKAGLAQAWNFRDVCSFYLILLAKESDLNKPQQWLLLCPQRSVTDKNIFLGADTSLHSTSQCRQSLPGLPDMLHEERTKIQRKSPQKGADRKHTFPTPVYLISSLEGVVCFNLLAATRVLVRYSADILAAKNSHSQFPTFPPFSVLWREANKQPEPISQLRAL